MAFGGVPVLGELADDFSSLGRDTVELTNYQPLRTEMMNALSPLPDDIWNLRKKYGKIL